MYASKDRRGVNGVSFFDQSLNAKIEREHQIDLALRRARFDEEFSLVFQPQYAVGGRRLMGMEALIRWNPPSLGRIPPDEFIPIAEANRTILPLSDWITDKAIAQIADWNRRFSAKWVMGINVSPLQIDDENFLQRLDETLRSRAVDPSWINLEMTERCAMKEETAVLGFFDLLAKRGIASSIDDFGTGYSSLAYLKKFNIDYLKIAKQLIDGIAERDIDRQIVQAIIMMATALELRTIAEGVEDERQFDLLASLGVDEIQGYILGKPLPPDEFEREFIAREVSPPSLS
jgi:EAL domain-containing protein (putative c-di-GMP-specific phosphodiesterase class I)